MRKLIFLLLIFPVISITLAEDIKISNTDLQGLVKCQNIIFNIIELTVNNGKIIDYFNNQEITHWIFRKAYSNDNFNNFVKTINSRFRNIQFLYDKIDIQNAQSIKIDGTISKFREIEIRIRSVTTNKIIIFFFRNNEENGVWKLSGYADCINYHERVPHMDDPGPPCIDE